jgi:hypothetical protein
MTKTKKKRSPRPKCEECGSTKNVINGLCESCEEDHVWCNVCERWFSTEGETCRHVFWTDCGWYGAGQYEGDWDNSKEPFWAFLDVMAKVVDPCVDDYPDLVTGIESEIRKDAFWTRLEGFMLSTPDLLFYRLRPDLPRHDGKITCLSFARIRPSQIERDDSAVADGFAWLQSLCADETKAANRRTLIWIREWRKERA